MEGRSSNITQTNNENREQNSDQRKVKQLKQDIKQIKENTYRSCLQELISQMNEKKKKKKKKKKKRLVKISTEKGVSNWLTMLPITEHDFELSKQQYWDSVGLRYGWEITNLPTFCPWGSKIDIQHKMSCKKAAFAFRTFGIFNLR